MAIPDYQTLMRPLLDVLADGTPQGNGGWLLAVEPLLGVPHARDAWAPALGVLHLRAH